MSTRLPRLAPTLVLACITAGTAACGDATPTDQPPLGGALTVTGDVVDFQTGAAIAGTAMVSTAGLVKAPTITVEGTAFVLEDVLEHSAFQIVASAPPTHRTTYNAAIEVVDVDVANIKAYTVAEQLLDALATSFGVTPSTQNGVLLIQLVDMAGTPKAGVAGSNIVLLDATGATAVKFLDASLAADANATASSSSGWAVFFEVPPGIVSIGQAVNATASLAMPSVAVAANAVTLARAFVTDGTPPNLPTNISFSQTVFPIFSARGCVACHSGGGPGKDLGGLMLDGGVNLAYRELTVENPLRVQTATPEASLLLTMPSAESPPDRHPNITFTGPQDPDYVKILVWIREGAKNN